MIIEPSHIFALGLTPFLYRFYETGSLISLIIYFNGIIFHVFLPNNFIMKWFDVICNMIFIAYVNLKALDFYVFMWSYIGCSLFLINAIVEYKIIKTIIHVLGVHVTLYRALKISGY